MKPAPRFRRFAAVGLLCAALPASTAPNRPPAAPLVQTELAPVQVIRKAEGHYFVDFGKAWFGTALFEFPAGHEGRRVVVKLGEARQDATSVHPKPGGTVRYQEHTLTLDAAARRYRLEPTWAPPGWMRGGWVDLPEAIGKLMPFRYLEVINVPEPFTAGHVRLLATHVPFDDTAAHFHSSNWVLNDVWDLCKHTIKATTFTGLYVDGDRERKPYEADAFINQLAHYCVDLHHETARRTHEYLLARPTWPTEWRLQSVLIGWLDYLWSGNATLLRQHYDTLKARGMNERRTADGLFRGFNDGEPRDIVDWPAGERDGYDMKPDVKTVVTAFHFEAVRLLAEIARATDRAADAAEFDRLAAQTRAAVNARLWDAARGVYVDGLDSRTGTRSTNASLHANLFPLAFGLVPEERRASVLAFIKSRGMACSVYGAQFLLDALYDAGEADYALELLTATHERSWAHMIYGVGSTMALEAWDAKFKPNLDWNHAWGAAPANLIPRKLMGIEPLTPGFQRFRVRPQLAALEHATVTLPAPPGPIRLAVRQPANGPWTATLTVPPGTEAEFHAPTPDARRVRVNGRPHQELAAGDRLPAQAGRVVLRLPPGEHEVRVERARQAGNPPRPGE